MYDWFKPNYKKISCQHTIFLEWHLYVVPSASFLRPCVTPWLSFVCFLAWSASFINRDAQNLNLQIRLPSRVTSCFWSPVLLRMGTKLSRLSHERRQIEGRPGSWIRTSGRNLDLEEDLENTQERVRELEKRNEGLRNRLLFYKQQLQLQGCGRHCPYGYVAPRVNTGLRRVHTAAGRVPERLRKGKGVWVLFITWKVQGLAMVTSYLSVTAFLFYVHLSLNFRDYHNWVCSYQPYRLKGLVAMVVVYNIQLSFSFLLNRYADERTGSETNSHSPSKIWRSCSRGISRGDREAVSLVCPTCCQPLGHWGPTSDSLSTSWGRSL